MLPFGISDFHVAVDPNAQLAAQHIELFRLERSEVLFDGVEAFTAA